MISRRRSPVRGIADHDSSSRRDGKLRNILYFGSNVGGNSRLFRVCHGQFYRLRVDVIAVCPDLGIPFDRFQCLPACLFPYRSWYTTPFFCGEPAVDARGDIHSFQHGFDQQRAGSTEGVADNGIVVQAGKIDNACSERFFDRRQQGRLAIPAFMQSAPGTVQKDCDNIFSNRKIEFGGQHRFQQTSFW